MFKIYNLHDKKTHCIPLQTKISLGHVKEKQNAHFFLNLIIVPCRRQYKQTLKIMHFVGTYYTDISQFTVPKNVKLFRLFTEIILCLCL
jgi:hypothetical protein